MGRSATSRERGTSWSGAPRRARAGLRLRRHDPTRILRDPELVQRGILEALRVGDFPAVVEFYRAHLAALNRTRTAKALGVTRQYVHRMVKHPANPSLRTFAAFMKDLAARTGGPPPA